MNSTSSNTFLIPIDAKTGDLLVTAGNHRFNPVQIGVPNLNAGTINNLATQHVSRNHWGKVHGTQVLENGHICIVHISRPTGSLKLNSQKAWTSYMGTQVNGNGRTIAIALSSGAVKMPKGCSASNPRVISSTTPTKPARGR